jgi:spore coat polysaccharide biosynthesis protein SpsF (cytidylyltransferase family)
MIVAIIQARMGSTRLPGKVLEKVDGVPLLKIMLDRVSLSKRINQVVIATSTLPNDDQIVGFCCDEGVEVFRGSEENVLSRYFECATEYGAKTIVRLTADCPLVDPEVIDDVVELFESSGVDFAANTVPPENSTFPDGSDVEVFSYTALSRAYKEVKNSSDKEHVTFYFWKDPARNFKTKQLQNSENWSKFRLTVDYPEDLEVVKQISGKFCNRKKIPRLAEIINYIEERPEIFALNSKYNFGEGWNKL